MDCIFCKIVSGEIPCKKIYEDEFVLVFLDIAPVSDGHSIVIPKKHYEKVQQSDETMLFRFMVAIGKVGDHIAQAVGAEGFNILCNNGRCAGQIVDHVHFHIIPRKAGDGILSGWPTFKYTEEQADEIFSKIVKKLENSV